MQVKTNKQTNKQTTHTHPSFQKKVVIRKKYQNEMEWQMFFFFFFYILFQFPKKRNNILSSRIWMCFDQFSISQITLTFVRPDSLPSEEIVTYKYTLDVLFIFCFNLKSVNIKIKSFLLWCAKIHLWVKLEIFCLTNPGSYLQLFVSFMHNLIALWIETVFHHHTKSVTKSRYFNLSNVSEIDVKCARLKKFNFRQALRR